MKRAILGFLAIVVLIAIGLFATGFWSANIQEGQLPKIQVRAEGGKLPGVDVDSKKVVVGTQKAEVPVPSVGTEKKQVDVPMVAVKENGEQ